MNVRSFFLRWWLSLTCCAVTLLLVAAAYAYGRNLGFDRKIGDPVNSAQVSIAISDSVYGLNQGYVGHRAVYNALETAGWTVEPNWNLRKKGIVHPDNLNNPALLDEALRRATSLGALPGQVWFGDGSAVVGPWDNLGMVNYYKMAFGAFGYNVAALYKLYFLLFLASVLAFLAGHFRQPQSLVLLATVCVTQLLTFAFVAHGFVHGLSRFFGYGYETLISEELNTIHNTRFLSALGIVPTLHLALAALRIRRPRIPDLALAAMQTVILVFALSIRCTGPWMVLTVVLAGAAVLGRPLLRWMRDRNRTPLPPGRLLHHLVPLWPAALLLLWLGAARAHESASVDPFYQISDEYLLQHNFWHSVYLGLAWHPDWRSRFPPQIQAVANDGDALAYLADREYVERRFGLPGDYLLSSVFPEVHKEKTRERALKEAYFEFAGENSLYVLTGILVHKPLFFLALYGAGLGRSLWAVGVLPCALGLLLVTALFFLLRVYGGVSRKSMLFALLLVAGAAAISALPLFLTCPLFHAMSDQFWMLTLSLLLAAAFGLSEAAVRTWEWRAAVREMQREKEKA